MVSIPFELSIVPSVLHLRKQNERNKQNIYARNTKSMNSLGNVLARREKIVRGSDLHRKLGSDARSSVYIARRFQVSALSKYSIDGKVSSNKCGFST